MVYIVGFIIFCVIMLAVFSVHAPIGNTQIGLTIDKIVEYLGIVAIPLVLFYFSQQQQDKQQKRENEKEKLEKLEKEKQEQLIHEQYVTQAKAYIRNISQSLERTVKSLKNSDPNIELGKCYWNNGFERSSQNYFDSFKHYINEYEHTQSNRDTVLQILLRMGILRETRHPQYNQPIFQENIAKIKETYPEETLLLPILEKMIEKFRDDNDGVINEIVTILKEFDNEQRPK